MKTEIETKHTAGLLKACRKCKGPYTPTAHQLAKRDYICPPCNAAFQVQYKKYRKAAGRPVKGGKASDSWWRNYRAVYYAKPENRIRIAANVRRYRKDPVLRIRHRARWTANHAQQSGKLTKDKCAACGNPSAEKHHPDYSKPLLVIWLCKSCHRALHAKAKGAR